MRIFEFCLAPDSIQAVIDAGKSNLAAAIRKEPGVLAMFFGADSVDPAKVYVVEVYKDQTAYNAHAASDHFRHFQEAVRGKIVSRRVIETNPMILGTKEFIWDD